MVGLWVPVNGRPMGNNKKPSQEGLRDRVMGKWGKSLLRRSGGDQFC